MGITYRSQPCSSQLTQGTHHVKNDAGLARLPEVQVMPHHNVEKIVGSQRAIGGGLDMIASAKEFLLTGDIISATEAERIGLINHVVPADQLMEKAMAFAARLANGTTKAIRWTKVSVNKILRDTANLVLDTSLALEKQCFSTEDHKEAIRSFVEKREAKFTGR